MRLLIVGTLNGQLTTATKLAMDKGAAKAVFAESDSTSRIAAMVLRGNAEALYGAKSN